MKDLTEKELSVQEIYNGTVLHVQKHTVRLPDGSEAPRELIRHVGAVCVLPLTDDGRAVLERQYRYPIAQSIIEIPAGKLDSFDEDRLHAAKRELREETGITADRWTDMGLYYGAPAYSDEKITMYLAEGLHKGSQQLDEDEFLEVFTMPLSELVAKIVAGEIIDGKTQAAVLKAAEILRQRGK